MNKMITGVLMAAGGFVLSYVGNKISAPVYERERQREIDERVREALKRERDNDGIIDVEIEK